MDVVGSIKRMLEAEDLSFGFRESAFGGRVTMSGGGDEADMTPLAARKILGVIEAAWGNNCADVILLGGMIEAAETASLTSPHSPLQVRDGNASSPRLPLMREGTAATPGAPHGER